VTFEVAGLTINAFDGGPMFTFNEAISLYVDCADQAEVDYYWQRLTEGGEESQCGWLKDRFGVSWQVVPRALPRLLGDPDPGRAQRAMQAMLSMRKIDVAALEAAVGSGTS
jgi:predicted 3-demethylubiquinone-9 3-methyltransferase (glyoxalase superfamily)